MKLSDILIASLGIVFLTSNVQAVEIQDPKRPGEDIINSYKTCESGKPGHDWEVDFRQGEYCSYTEINENYEYDFRSRSNAKISTFTVRNNSGLLLIYNFSADSHLGKINKSMYIATGQSSQIQTRGETIYNMHVKIDAMFSSWDLFRKTSSDTATDLASEGYNICIQAKGTLFNPYYNDCSGAAPIPIIPAISCLIIYEDVNFGGASRNICDNQSSLGIFSEIVSSYKIPKNWTVRFFTEENYQNEYHKRTSMNSHDPVLDNVIKSIKILKNNVCGEDDYDGDCILPSKI